MFFILSLKNFKDPKVEGWCRWLWRKLRDRIETNRELEERCWSRCLKLPRVHRGRKVSWRQGRATVEAQDCSQQPMRANANYKQGYRQSQVSHGHKQGNNKRESLSPPGKQREAEESNMWLSVGEWLTHKCRWGHTPRDREGQLLEIQSYMLGPFTPEDS